MGVMQQLHDSGLNPFAAKLLVESWNGHPKPAPTAFVLDDVVVLLGSAKDKSWIEDALKIVQRPTEEIPE